MKVDLNLIYRQLVAIWWQLGDYGVASMIIKLMHTFEENGFDGEEGEEWTANLEY